MVTSTRPHALARQLRKIADILERSDPDDRVDMGDYGLLDLDDLADNNGLKSGDELNRVAESIYSSRRLRDKMFGADLFGEAAWDILLDLYISESHARRVSLKSAAIGSQLRSPPRIAG